LNLRRDSLYARGDGVELSGNWGDGRLTHGIDIGALDLSPEISCCLDKDFALRGRHLTSGDAGDSPCRWGEREHRRQDKQNCEIRTARGPEIETD